VDQYVTFFEDLIHAIKSEIIGKVEHLQHSVDANRDAITDQIAEQTATVRTSLEAGQDAIGDQIALQAATVRTLRDEVERLRTLTEQLEHRMTLTTENGGNRASIGLDELTTTGA
jgi:phage shock protein A